MIRVPALRAGKAYYSREVIVLHDYATRAPIAEVGLANAGLISRDLRRDDWSALQTLRMTEVLDFFKAAAKHFMEDELPVGDAGQSPQEFVAAQSATTGLPEGLCRLNMEKIEAAMTHMGETLDGLTRGLSPDTLDNGFGQRDDHMISFTPAARRFGAVLPANSPGVHALWLPAIALKMPVALKPGQREPWTPLRILEALIRAGFPGSGFGFYPAGHDGGTTLLQRCGAGMIFGAGPTVEPWRHRPQIEVHGPGYSKILLGPDKAQAWESFLDLIVGSVADNNGRSCVNASSIRTASHAKNLAMAVAERLATIKPRPRDDAKAQLAAFPDADIAQAINAAIDQGLAEGGAEDLTEQFRKSPRLVEFEGASYLLPTVILCESLDHPLANQEYLFPFVSVVESSADDLISGIGASLVLTALTEDPVLERELLALGDIGRLNLGPVPTNRIQWDQPHEGNIFESLFQQRAFQREPFATAGAMG